MPRRYRMAARAAEVEQTRRRIVEASKALHAEQGMLGTSYGEIAQRAGTAQATVYRHFPSLDALLPACAQSIQVLRPLTPEQAADVFRGTGHLSTRLEVLVRGTCDCYERDQGWLHAARREEDLVPALGEIGRVQRNSLVVLTRAALAGTAASDRTVCVVAALLDFPVWRSFRDMGLSEADAADQVLQLVRDYLAREGIG